MNAISSFQACSLSPDNARKVSFHQSCLPTKQPSVQARCAQRLNRPPRLSNTSLRALGSCAAPLVLSPKHVPTFATSVGMKFGKRLTAEAERHWREFYIDYKVLKRAIQVDIDGRDHHGRAFERMIKQELQKVSAFYVDKEEELQAVMELLSTASPEVIAAFSSEVKALKKYVVLNYICVVKAAKKRNRHLRAVCGQQVVSIRAVDILSHQYFFTSPKLASMGTQAEVLSQALEPVTDILRQEYACPICLGLLRGPVVLTCAHRFCWGCILAHCTTVMSRLSGGGSAQLDPAADEKDGKAGQGAVMVPSWEGEHSDDEPTLATFDCPVCRKAQLLDLDRLQVDPHLDTFVRRLERQGQQQAATASVEVEEQRSATAEPMAIDASPAAVPPASVQQPLPEHTPPAEVSVLKVEAMDAVLEYLHKEHRALEEDKKQRQQQEREQPEREDKGAEAVPAASAPQRSMSQPVAISSASMANGSRSQQAEDMEVDARPSVRSGLLEAASEVTSPLKPNHALAAARAVVPRPPLLPAAPPLATQQQQQQLREAPSPFQPAAAAQAEAQVAAPGPQVLLEQMAPASGEPPLLPPQRPEDHGKLTVCLDLDGTLVSTFTPKRAPVLPSTSVSYVVGRGGKLNPGGVFVVERPGLLEFFRRICPVAEVVLFTAGLEDYAAPICDVLQDKYGCFLHRLYRPACVPDEVYPCVKDMARLGRDMKRCVLVDDTPLAFFRQPDNGIPILNFRGDVDDQLLSEAVAPLIESLVGVADVRAALSRRFNMTRWFQAQGLMTPRPLAPPMHRAPSMPALPRPATAPAGPRPHTMPHAQHHASSTEILHQQQRGGGVMLVCDFDKTLIDYDAGERLVNELAPELTSLLAHLEMPANFVPVTNTVLAEMQRRGISRDRILSTLRTMGQEVPLATVRMLQWASRAGGIDVRVLSDCNSVFINHVLIGAKVNSCVREVVTNFAAFHQVEAPAMPQQQQGEGEEGEAQQAGGWLQRAFGGGRRAMLGGGDMEPPKPASQRLVITPRHPYHDSSHGCPLCPENLCKGQELQMIWASSGPRKRTIYCGDGANDLCPALLLAPHDVVLVRKGHGLQHLIEKRRNAPEGIRRVHAEVHLWSTHEELWQLVQEAASI